MRKDKNEVRVRGSDEENVKQAVERITQIAGESDDVISLDVPVPENTNAIAVIVGKKGVGAMRLQNEFHISLNVVREESKVVLRGLKDDVEKAKIGWKNCARTSSYYKGAYYTGDYCCRNYWQERCKY